jgi:hypothetical protein
MVVPLKLIIPANLSFIRSDYNDKISPSARDSQTFFLDEYTGHLRAGPIKHRMGQIDLLLLGSQAPITNTPAQYAQCPHPTTHNTESPKPPLQPPLSASLDTYTYITKQVRQSAVRARPTQCIHVFKHPLAAAKVRLRP